jgi:hypothetical protein
MEESPFEDLDALRMMASSSGQRSPRKRGRRYIGVPLDFMCDVCRQTTGRATLIVAMFIYRRTVVCRSRTVTLPTTELAEVGLSRSQKNKALVQLEAAKLLRRKPARVGQSTRVTLLWR